ncbi:putative AMFR protein [Usnea florida]
MPDQQQTLSVPSLLLLAAFAALTIRYFFFTKTTNPPPRTNPRAANPADVEQIATMFPQIGRREIMWDLQRNGGSVNATTERILGRGSLDTPPPSFQPNIPVGATPTTANTSPGQIRSEHVDLITRYNLGSRISSPPSTPAEGSGLGSAQTESWSNNKNERQALLKRRREEMILNARRKLEEKERGQLQRGG